MSLFAWPGEDPLVSLVKFLFRPFAEQAERNAKAEKFKEKTKNCIVITNESNENWKFGCTDKLGNELKDKASGTMEVSVVKSDGLEFWPAVSVDGKTEPVTIRRLYGTIVIKPVVTKSGYITWDKFSRVCFLEDAAGKRIYLTLTKDTPNAAVPVIGVAGVSNRVLIDQKALHFSDKNLKNFNMIGISVDKLKD
ncbi:MAG: hypothetical protein HGA66_04425 [Holophaga sp.]|nr:hypothetical protein [Holophaga sp.]